MAKECPECGDKFVDNSFKKKKKKVAYEMEEKERAEARAGRRIERVSPLME